MSLNQKYILEQTRNETRKKTVAEDFSYLIREAICTQADLIQDNTLHSYQHFASFIVDRFSKKLVYLTQSKTLKWDYKNIVNNFYFRAIKCQCCINNNRIDLSKALVYRCFKKRC